MGPLIPSQRVEEQATLAPAAVSDGEIEEPDVATKANSSASALVVLEALALSPPVLFRRADIRNPSKPLLCVVQAKNPPSRPVGSFAEDTNDWAFQLTFDAGRRRAPTMTMRFFSTGIEGPDCGQTGWSLSGYIENDPMITDF